VLTDRGSEFCGNPERHEYELYLAVEDIDHSRTKTKSPQTNGVRAARLLLQAQRRLNCAQRPRTSLLAIQKISSPLALDRPAPRIHVLGTKHLGYKTFGWRFSCGANLGHHLRRSPRPPVTPPSPPRELSGPGRDLWDRITKEFVIDDSAAQEVLQQCCEAVNRLEAIAARVRTDGEVISDGKGGQRSHPSLRDEILNRG
jgi:hypothetical protein